MKRVLVTAVLAACFAGCMKVEDDENVDGAWTHHGMDNYTKVVEIEGHKYIIMDGPYSGSIIHAASCGCMKKINL